MRVHIRTVKFITAVLAGSLMYLALVDEEDVGTELFDENSDLLEEEIEQPETPSLLIQQEEIGHDI